MSNVISSEIKEASKLTSEEWKEWTKTVWSIANISDSIHPAVYPPEIPYRLIRMFSFVGETVLDPFSGMATTGRVALQNNRSYIGFETNPVYHSESLRRLSESVLPENSYNCHYDVSNSSSCDMSPVKDDSVGIVVTSPPYWNKANYGEYDGNIGGFEYYDDFLVELQKVFAECYRVLKPGRKMCVVTATRQARIGRLFPPTVLRFWRKQCPLLWFRSLFRCGWCAAHNSYECAAGLHQW